MKDITDVLVNHKYSYYHILKKLNLETKFLELTSFLDKHYKNVSVNQRRWHILNNKLELERCECGNLAVFNEKHSKYYPCSKECLLERSKKRTLEKYGVQNVSMLNSVKDKIKSTVLKKYHTDNVSKNQEIKSKISKSLVKKYRDNPEIIERMIKSQESKLGSIGIFSQKSIETKIKKYSTPNVTQNEDIKAKIRKTVKEKYGVDSTASLRFVREKMANTIFTKTKEKYLKIGYEIIERNEKSSVIKHILCNNIFTLEKNITSIGTHNRHNLCPICYPDSKKNYLEKELLSFIKSIIPNETIIENDRSVIPPKELDIFIPSLKIAIEFNGVYWHKADKVGKFYHRDKLLLCNEKGIALIQIWEDDWILKKEIVKSILSNKLNQSSFNKIFARKCLVKEVTKSEEKSFLEDNHLQGYNSSTVCYGLYHNNELVQLISFVNKKDHWEIQRLCTKKYVNVIGGFSKLFKHFLNNLKEPKKIISYVNADVFTADSYIKNGFVNLGLTDPGYFYSDMGIRYHRQNFQKHKLIKDHLELSNLTEKEIMKELGYEKIYNSGNYKLVYEVHS